MRWLAHRGGALDFRDFALAKPGQAFPIAVALGADPATILGAVTPVPDTLSEYQFAGLLRGSRTEVVDTQVGDAGMMLQVPASAEFVLEGHIPTASPGFEGLSEHGVPVKEINGYLHALEGPFGDHTGYYNEQAWFPVFEIGRITHRQDPIYHSTYTGKPPDEPAVLGVALNEVFVPILQKQFPEIVDFYLPPEGCSYRMAIISIRKSYPGHAKRLMFGLWSFLRQFMYTKFIVVTDDDVDIRNWQDVVWAITTRMDPVRDTTLVDHTPIDYLDFASPVSGLGGKMGLDATSKWPGETTREWGRIICMDAAVEQRVAEHLEQDHEGRGLNPAREGRTRSAACNPGPVRTNVEMPARRHHPGRSHCVPRSPGPLSSGSPNRWREPPDPSWREPRGVCRFWGWPRCASQRFPLLRDLQRDSLRASRRRPSCWPDPPRSPCPPSCPCSRIPA